MDYVTSHTFGPFHPFQAFELDRYDLGPVGREKTMEFRCRAIEICDEFWLFGISERTLSELLYVINWNTRFLVRKPIKEFLKKFDPDAEQQYEKLKPRFGDLLALIEAAS